MNSQDGRCTAAYESKAFPYFSINVSRDVEQIDEKPGEYLAMIHRLRTARKFRSLLDVLEVDVDDAGGFHTSTKWAIDGLMASLREAEGTQYVSWVKHEAL
ncbi:TPA_asm: hypothetical protein [ssRNA phage SRR5466725_19]|uniref:Uncharacterized protein n=1 Tax=ssRNA phage SRR5466725_19 TaxID=2786417 RepID=A0A8S5L527_9VIRU|nr:hypothetical protein QIK50_gp3 [ssRNA phage SRR5466725_19]DAD52431.1 TPA_asm: hypothetical protein [ssRNA phage SRR5466725_19]